MKACITCSTIFTGTEAARIVCDKGHVLWVPDRATRRGEPRRVHVPSPPPPALGPFIVKLAATGEVVTVPPRPPRVFVESNEYCPWCGATTVWVEDSRGGDHVLGEQHVCASCRTEYYLSDEPGNPDDVLRAILA